MYVRSRKIESKDEEPKIFAGCLSVYFGAECMDTEWARGQRFYEQHTPQITVAKHISHSCLILQNKPMRVLTERRVLHQQHASRQNKRWLETDKVKILHDNDMYSFLLKHVCSNLDKRTEWTVNSVLYTLRVWLWCIL